MCPYVSGIPHTKHRCDNTQCPVDCQLCKRLCSEHDHLHGLEPDATHLCGYVRLRFHSYGDIRAENRLLVKSMHVLLCAKQAFVKLILHHNRSRRRLLGGMRVSSTPRFVHYHPLMNWSVHLHYIQYTQGEHLAWHPDNVQIGDLNAFISVETSSLRGCHTGWPCLTCGEAYS